MLFDKYFSHTIFFSVFVFYFARSLISLVLYLFMLSQKQWPCFVLHLYSLLSHTHRNLQNVFYGKIYWKYIKVVNFDYFVWIRKMFFTLQEIWYFRWDHARRFETWIEQHPAFIADHPQTHVFCQTIGLFRCFILHVFQFCILWGRRFLQDMKIWYSARSTAVKPHALNPTFAVLPSPTKKGRS